MDPVFKIKEYFFEINKQTPHWISFRYMMLSLLLTLSTCNASVGEIYGRKSISLPPQNNQFHKQTEIVCPICVPALTISLNTYINI